MCASVPVKIMDGNGAPLIEVLKSPPKAISCPSRQYHQTLAAGSLSPTSVASNCYTTTDNMSGITSSPDSESMSPPMSTSPAVVPELGRHFSLDDAKLPTPVAVVSGSMNGISTSVQVDKTHGEIMKRTFAADGGKMCLVRKRSGDDLQSRRLPPRAAVAAIPRYGSSYVRRKLSTTPIVSLSTSPQPMGRSPNNATAGELSPSGGILLASPSKDSYYLSSKLNTNSTATHIEVSEGPFVG
uniref:Enhancer of polycomb-like protein n=1 Tax=Parascaris univalens TaxID=6257 RepID=A0A915B4X0_PARUN